jgi:hypothetical protein
MNAMGIYLGVKIMPISEIGLLYWNRGIKTEKKGVIIFSEKK